jgi:hypothetical protein
MAELMEIIDPKALTDLKECNVLLEEMISLVEKLKSLNCNVEITFKS